MHSLRQLLPGLIVFLMRTLTLTLRFRLEDRAGVARGEVKGPILWAFWHNRMLICPIGYARFCPGRRGHCLTSPSKDGALIAGVMERLGVGSIRGSSSRRGTAALLEMIAILESGDDVCITPDGPRGPKYRLNPGIVKLAQLTGTPVVPLHIGYSRFWEIKSWDAFRIPKPFSTVSIVFDQIHHVCPTDNDEAFETERARLEAALRAGSDAVDRLF